MKRIIVILVISFVAFGCKAQTVVSRTKASGKNIVYANSGKVEKTGRIIVSNEKNKLQDVKPHFPLSAGVIPDLNIAKLDESQLTRILLEALSINKLKQMQDQKDLYIFLYLSDKGEILELWFFADQKTKINAHELEYIETNIKNRIHATFAKDDLKGSNFIPLLRSFNFAKLLQLKQSD